MDDVGIDQMASVGYGGLDKPKVPNIDLIANAGVKFTNVWVTPECSPSRAAFFTGRYPLRTGVTLAIVDNHLPQTFVSSYETTTPHVLATADYTSAMVGKYHLGGPNNDPAGDCAPSTRGWDFFNGNMTAGPPSIDTTGGGVAAEGTFMWGYNQTREPGACYVEDEDGITCEFLAQPAADGTSPSRTCLQRGGLFTTGQPCQSPTPPLQNMGSNLYS
jgi:arylsulfatase A-like enzyme